MASIAVYWLLQLVLPIAAAYTVAYLCGIALNALLSGHVVFGVAWSRRDRVRAFVGYAAVFAVSLTLVTLLQEGVGLLPPLAALAAPASRLR